MNANSNSTVYSHRDLIVWQRAMDLVDDIYDIADTLPSRENFGLFSQLTRTAISVPANIAEGRARSTARDFAHFLVLSRSSLMELDTLLEVAVRRKYTTRQTATELLDHVTQLSKMLSTLRRKIDPPRKRAQLLTPTTYT
jgi:four helix bundle protein